MTVDTRDKILEAADALFGSVGFDAATTREIAESSGVNKALIHYHFKSKDDLLESVLDRYYERFNKVLLGSLSASSDIRGGLELFIDAYFDFLCVNKNFARILQRETASGKHLELINRHLAPMFAMGVEKVQEAFPATRSGDMAAYQLILSFYGMIVSYFIYSDVLKDLTGKNPLSKKELKARKDHLHKMLSIVYAKLAGSEHKK